MIIVPILFALILGKFEWSQIQNETKREGQILHRICLAQVPQDSIYPDVYAALVCGENLTNEKIKRDFIETSLIHVIVVSGTHLLFLMQIFSLVNLPLGFQ